MQKLVTILLMILSVNIVSNATSPAQLTSTITWEITPDGVLRICGTGDMPDFGLEKNKYWRAKKYVNAIRRIEIGEGITGIGEYNFAELYPSANIQQTTITLPSTIRRIAYSAFENLTFSNSNLPAALEECHVLSFTNCHFPNDEIIFNSSIRFIAWDGVNFIHNMLGPGHRSFEKIILGPEFNSEDNIAGWLPYTRELVVKSRKFDLSKLIGQEYLKDVVITIPDGVNPPAALLAQCTVVKSSSSSSLMASNTTERPARPQSQTASRQTPPSNHVAKPADKPATDKPETPQSQGQQTATPALPEIDRLIPEGSSNRPNTFALIIANENYRRAIPVEFAGRDGEAMYQYCLKTLGLPKKNIRMVKDASYNDMRYQLDNIRSICEAYDGDASLIVYYAGHGIPDESTGSAYLLPVDGYAERVTSGLSMKELTDELGGLPVRQVAFFVDACFSGINRSGKVMNEARAVAIKAKPQAADGKLVLFSAAQGTEFAQPYGEQQHGLFTYYLLKKLSESRGEVTLGELADYIIANVRRTAAVEGKPQTPTVSASPSLQTWRTLRL